MSTAKPWTEAHRREAEARCYEIAAEMRRAGHAGVPVTDFFSEDRSIRSEQDFRDVLDCGPPGHKLDGARIDREVRRVRDLAEGRLVRETRWGVHFRDTVSAAPWTKQFSEREPCANVARMKPGARVVVRVNRIRRAS